MKQPRVLNLSTDVGDGFYPEASFIIPEEMTTQEVKKIRSRIAREYKKSSSASEAVKSFESEGFVRCQVSLCILEF